MKKFLRKRQSKDHARFHDTLDIIKFICKEFWSVVFKKPIDNLKTNHRGVYVIFDQDFCLFHKMCSSEGTKETIRQVSQYLSFPCGIVRGALSALGLQSVVTADISSYPQCILNHIILGSFQIKL